MDERLQFHQRAVDLRQDLGGLQMKVDRPVPRLGRGNAHRSLAGRGGRLGLGRRRDELGLSRDRAGPLGSDRRLVDR